MRVAIVHDWLNTKMGGAESLLLEMAALYPDAPIYTLIYDRQAFGDAIDPERIRTSFLQKFPAFIKKRPRYLLPLIPTAIEQLDLSEFDLVLSQSGAYAKGVITRPETLHICYCNSPMRAVWDYWPRYVDEQGVGPVRRMAIHRLTSKLRLWDYYSAARVDVWIANSKNVASRIKKYYHQNSVVIYPGAHTDRYQPVATHLKEDYFVTLANLTPYKKIDLAIEACNRLGKPLVVIGEGSDRRRLEQLAGPTIHFAGRVGDAELPDLLAKARALIFPNEEDFGIAPIDAMAAGTPVIAYGKGGVTETVVAGKTGVFFDQPTTDSLAECLQRFDEHDFKTSDLVARSKRFTMSHFRHELEQFVEEAYAKRHR